MRRIMFHAESFFSGILIGACFFLWLAIYDQPKAKPSRPSTNAVMCESGRGRAGEMAHFRNEIEGFPMLLCNDMLASRKARYPLTSEELFCSPTESCPP